MSSFFILWWFLAISILGSIFFAAWWNERHGLDERGNPIKPQPPGIGG
ncbi:hypothetical protein [Candidatus Spongiihabitans sp.]